MSSENSEKKKHIHVLKQKKKKKGKKKNEINKSCLQSNPLEMIFKCHLKGTKRKNTHTQNEKKALNGIESIERRKK